MPALSDYHWELYNIGEDYSEYNDLAASNPDKLKELQGLFLTEAAKYQVLPLDNSGFVRLLTPKPSAVAGRTDFTYTGENVGIPVGNAPSILDRDYTITANITMPEGGAEGIIATMGGRFGGYGLLLSSSFNWWLKRSLFRRIGFALLFSGCCLRGSLRAASGRELGYAFLLIAVLGLVVFATDVFGIGRGRPVFVYNFLDLERFSWDGSALSTRASTPSCSISSTMGPVPPRAVLAYSQWTAKRSPARPSSTRFRCSCPSTRPSTSGLIRARLWNFSYDVPFRFTGTIDKLNYKLGPEQMSAEDKRKAAEMLAGAKD